MTKTQIYLAPSQHHALREEAHQKHLSMAALLRRIVEQHFTTVQSVSEPPSPTLYAAIIGLGVGGDPRVSEHHDQEVGRAVDEHRRRRAR